MSDMFSLYQVSQPIHDMGFVPIRWEGRLSVAKGFEIIPDEAASCRVKLRKDFAVNHGALQSLMREFRDF